MFKILQCCCCCQDVGLVFCCYFCVTSSPLLQSKVFFFTLEFYCGFHLEAEGLPPAKTPSKPTLNCSKQEGGDRCFLTCQSQVHISSGELVKSDLHIAGFGCFVPVVIRTCSMSTFLTKATVHTVAFALHTSLSVLLYLLLMLLSYYSSNRWKHYWVLTVLLPHGALHQTCNDICFTFTMFQKETCREVQKKIHIKQQFGP